MNLLLPDGTLLDLNNVSKITPDTSGPKIVFTLMGYAAVYPFTNVSAEEMWAFMAMIQNPPSVGTLILPSFGALPGAANIVITPVSGSHVGGTSIILSLPNTSPITECFMQGGKVTIDGAQATNIAWINHCCMILTTPAHAAAAGLAVKYYDQRGNVTATATYQYT